MLAVSRGGGSFSGHANVLYLTNHYPTYPVIGLDSDGYRGHAAVVIQVRDAPVLLVDTPYYREDLVAVKDVRVTHNLARSVADVLHEKKLEKGKIGLVEEGTIRYGLYEELANRLPKIQFSKADDILERMRMKKSENELRIIRKLGKVADRVADTFIQGTAPGTTEAEVAASVAKEIVSSGCAVYAIYIGSDWHALKWPFYGPDRKLRNKDMVHTDFWAAYEGYIFDFSRTVVIGTPTREQRELLEAASEMVKICLQKVKPRLTVSELARMIDDEAREGIYQT